MSSPLLIGFMDNGAIGEPDMSRLRALLVCVVIESASLAAGQDQLARLGEAKRLYESADFDAALVTIAATDLNALSPDQAVQMALYEVSCLIALDNTSLAEARVMDLVQADPLFRPPQEVAPRVAAFIDTIVDRLRPSLVHEHYGIGKAHFDRGDYAAALDEFGIVADLAKGDVSSSLAGARTLAIAFSDVARDRLSSAPSEVEPPVALRQNLPPVPPEPVQRLGPGPLNGIFELAINDQGIVVSVTVVKSIDPAYDALLMTAATQWKYRPAKQDGVPVAFVKRLDVNVIWTQ
jgi:hypothetical protein